MNTQNATIEFAEANGSVFNGMTFTAEQLLQVMYGIAEKHDRDGLEKYGTSGGYCKVYVDFPNGHRERFDCNGKEVPFLAGQLQAAFDKDQLKALTEAQAAAEEAAEAANKAIAEAKAAQAKLNEIADAIRGTMEAPEAAETVEAPAPAPAEEKAEEIAKFETGVVYEHGWIGDSQLFSYYTVKKRTACFVTLVDHTDGKEIRCKVSVYDGTERVKPLGSYSMAPTLRADKAAAAWVNK